MTDKHKGDFWDHDGGFDNEDKCDFCSSIREKVAPCPDGRRMCLTCAGVD